MTHSAIIKARAQELANLGDSSSEAVEFISTTILRNAAQRMESELNPQDYGNYVTMFTDNTYDSDAEYHLMTTSQKKLNTLESAEAYFCLYYLALALKEMTKGNVFLDRYETGTEGRSLAPSSIDKIIKMRERYENSAIDIVNNVYGNAIGLVVIP